MIDYILRMSGRTGKDTPLKVSAAVLPRVGERIEKGLASYKVTYVTHPISGLGVSEYITVRAEEI